MKKAFKVSACGGYGCPAPDTLADNCNGDKCGVYTADTCADSGKDMGA